MKSTVLSIMAGISSRALAEEKEGAIYALNKIFLTYSNEVDGEVWIVPV